MHGRVGLARWVHHCGGCHASCSSTRQPFPILIPHTFRSSCVARVCVFRVGRGPSHHSPAPTRRIDTNQRGGAPQVCLLPCLLGWALHHRQRHRDDPDRLRRTHYKLVNISRYSSCCRSISHNGYEFVERSPARLRTVTPDSCHRAIATRRRVTLLLWFSKVPKFVLSALLDIRSTSGRHKNIRSTSGRHTNDQLLCLC
jgi:hypothetical protein